MYIQVSLWEVRLSDLDEYLLSLNAIQRRWVYLEPIFGRGALPREEARFKRVDEDFRYCLSESDLLSCSFSHTRSLCWWFVLQDTNRIFLYRLCKHAQRIHKTQIRFDLLFKFPTLLWLIVSVTLGVYFSGTNGQTEFIFYLFYFNAHLITNKFLCLCVFCV